jgi:hypothetical protein
MLSQLLLKTIDDELTWRERELAFCKLQLLHDIGDSSRFEYSYRCFVAITYAHFEGFVKRVIGQALADIRNSGTRPSECAELMRSHLFAPELRRRISSHSNLELVTAICKGIEFLDEVSYPSEETIIECGNMSVGNFEWIAACVGLGAERFADFRAHVGRIVNLRHSGAHGERINFDSSKSNTELAGEIFDTQTQIITLIHTLAVEVISLFEQNGFRTPARPEEANAR